MHDGQRLDRERLGQAGHAFQQDVAVGQQADEQPFHQVFLADDHAADFVLQRLDPLAVLFYVVGEFLGRSAHGIGKKGRQRIRSFRSNLRR